MALNPRDDASLQAWGRHLGTVAPAVQEVASASSKVTEQDQVVASSLGKLAQMGESDLPASRSLTAEVQAAAAEAKSIADDAAALDARRRALAARAETLPSRYHREHETDEARLRGERGGRHRERRADVSAAEQDT